MSTGLNCYRSSISGFHENIEGLQVGQYLEVLHSVNRSFQSQTSSVEIFIPLGCSDCSIIYSIKKNWMDNKSLPNKNFTLKLTLLLALTSAFRASNIHHLDIRFMYLSEEKLVFTFAKLLKTWKNGRATPKLKFLQLRKTQIFV